MDSEQKENVAFVNKILKVIKQGYLCDKCESIDNRFSILDEDLKYVCETCDSKRSEE